MRIVEEFDHFVVPVNDMVAAEEFYPRVFGGIIARRNGLSVAQVKHGRPPHTFIDIGGKRFGVFLQTDERPGATALRGSPTFSFETTEAGLAETLAQLAAYGARWEGPLDEDRPFTARSIYFADPAGNYFHVYVPIEPRFATPVAGERMTALGYLELEAPDLEGSVRFYEQALGLELVGYGEDERRGLRQATMRLPSGQLLVLTEIEFSDKGMILGRAILGPHLGFFVPIERWDAALVHLDAIGIPNADRGAEGKNRGADLGTYMDDPAGNVVQFITQVG